MKRQYSFDSALLAAGLTLFAQTAASQSFETTARVRLREEPSTRADVVRVLDKHEPLSQLASDSASRGFIWVLAGEDSGWVASRYIRRVRLARAEMVANASVARPSGALASCPIIGTAQPGSTDALSNALKRRIPTPGPAKTLTFAEFAELQRDVEQVFGIDARQHKLNLDQTQRQRLQSLPIATGTIGEGDLVRLAAYIVDPAPHANTGESVNCGLHGIPNNDFHITVAEHPSDTGFQGVVVEMIPQNRPDGWNLHLLKQLESAQTQVLVIGQLFYDEKHLVNDDPSNPRSGQPQRFSLFEIHPVTELMVCQSSSPCDPDSANGWSPVPRQIP